MNLPGVTMQPLGPAWVGVPQETGRTDARTLPILAMTTTIPFMSTASMNSPKEGIDVKVVQVTLPDEVHSVLKDAAKNSRIAMAEVIRQILAQWAARKSKKGATP